MGAVYVVEHIAMRKRMALKVLHREMTDNVEVRTRFEREAIAAAHVDHPNVAAASDFGRAEDGTFFMVLEYIEGQSLRAVVDQGPMVESRAIALMKQMTSALVRAHELGVIHRDLKPENVMLVVRDGVEQVKVLDFGIAKLQGDLGDSGTIGSPGVPLTRLGVVFGTPEYISPEQAQGRTVDARADLYALGVIFFEMLSGRRPFEADDGVALLMMHAKEPAPALRDHAAGASNEACAIVARLLEKEPTARFDDARTLAAALDAVPSFDTPASITISGPTSVPASHEHVSGVAPTVIGRSPPPQGMRLPSALRSLPRPVLAIGAAAIVLVPLLVVLGVVATVVHSHRPTTTVGSSSSVANPAPTESSIDDEAVAAAASSGSSALERLAQRAPSDPRILRALVNAYSHEDKHAAAMTAITKWVAVEPSANKNADVESAILSAATGSTADVEAAIAVMEGPLGSVGVDLMLELLAKPGVAASTKTRLNQSLANPDVRAHASSAAAILIDLKAAKTCDARYAMLDRAKREGDARALTVLKPMQAKSGCGFLSRKDCWPCMRKGTALADAITEIEKKR